MRNKENAQIWIKFKAYVLYYFHIFRIGTVQRGNIHNPDKNKILLYDI